jgi:hypothetical protein
MNFEMTDAPIHWEAVTEEDNLPYIDEEQIISIEDRFNDLYEVRVGDLIDRLNRILSDKELAGFMIKLDQHLQSVDVLETLVDYTIGEIKKIKKENTMNEKAKGIVEELLAEL